MFYWSWPTIAERTDDNMIVIIIGGINEWSDFFLAVFWHWDLVANRGEDWSCMGVKFLHLKLNWNFNANNSIYFVWYYAQCNNELIWTRTKIFKTRRIFISWASEVDIAAIIYLWHRHVHKYVPRNYRKLVSRNRYHWDMETKYETFIFWWRQNMQLMDDGLWLNKIFSRELKCLNLVAVCVWKL